MLIKYKKELIKNLVGYLFQFCRASLNQNCKKQISIVKIIKYCKKLFSNKVEYIAVIKAMQEEL